MTFKFQAQRYSQRIALPSLPRTATADTEQLSGSVQNMTASAPEERLARAFDKERVNYIFQYIFGAPKGLPGWKSLDFVAMMHGMVYLFEVDTAFTHRDKAYKDVLHDALALNDKEIQSIGQIYPQVFHVDGDSELSNQINANAFVKRFK